ncbi:MAG: mannosyl-3-phosphoglycerate synthase [Desulfurococcaceae archaeon]
MIINLPLRSEVFGALKIHDMMRVINIFGPGRGFPTVLSMPSFKDLEDIMQSTTIIVPVKNENLSVLEKVLRAVPYDSPLIVVSASSIYPLNIFNEERSIVRNIYRHTGRLLIHVHQRDTVLADVIKEISPQIIDERGLIKYGKGEAMLIGALLADALKARFIGFIDADNLVPGAVTEYAFIYYTMFSISESKYTTVRIHWSYKGWAEGELYLRRMGRVSRIVSTLFNRLLSKGRLHETDIIKTSNSGEHAMSMELVKIIGFSSRFSVESGELIKMIELCYTGVDKGLCPAVPNFIEYYQVESLNPHIHAVKGEEHVKEMVAESLGTLYYSETADEEFKDIIKKTLIELGIENEPPKPTYYPYPDINPRKVLDELSAKSTMITILGA